MLEENEPSENSSTDSVVHDSMAKGDLEISDEERCDSDADKQKCTFEVSDEEDDIIKRPPITEKPEPKIATPQLLSLVADYGSDSDNGNILLLHKALIHKPFVFTILFFMKMNRRMRCRLKE